MKNSLFSLIVKAVLAGITIFFAVLPLGFARGIPQFLPPSGDDSVLVTSWKSGMGRVQERTASLTLGTGIEEYEYDFYDDSKKRHFRLSFRRVLEKTLKRPALPCWRAVMREITNDSSFGGSIVGYDLFSPEGPGRGDYFSREGWAEVFCPIEKPNRVLDGPFYPLKVKRVFLIEKFVLSLRATDYDYDEKTNNFGRLDLLIDLRNQ